MHIVVYDPQGEWWEGALVAEPEQARVLAVRGVCLLPVVPQLLASAADAGYFKRSWGKGIALPTGGHGALCPLSLYAQHDMPYLHWAARLLPTSDAERDAEGKLNPVRGILRFVPDGTQRGGVQAVLEGAEDRVDLERLGPPDAQGGWTVGGSARIRQMLDSKVCVSLHGSAMGGRPQLRVAWAAVTQTAEPG